MIVILKPVARVVPWYESSCKGCKPGISVILPGSCYTGGDRSVVYEGTARLLNRAPGLWSSSVANVR